MLMWIGLYLHISACETSIVRLLLKKLIATLRFRKNRKEKLNSLDII